MRVGLELRNLPHFRVMEYLVKVGGIRCGDLRIAGDGWTATLCPIPPAQVGSIRVPCDLLIIEGNTEHVNAVHAFIRQKTMRGGG